MYIWFLGILILSGLVGFIAAYFLRIIFLEKYFKELYKSVLQSTDALVTNLIAQIDIKSKISDPKLFDKIQPIIEAKVDDFLNVKLKAEIPMIGMLIGNKTNDKVKVIFINQLRTLFPEILSELTNQFDIENEIKTKLNGVLHQDTFKIRLKAFLNDKSFVINYLGLLVGLITGLINILLSYYYFIYAT